MKRFPDGLEGICSAVGANGQVYAVATDPFCAADITQQTLNTLQDLDRILAEMGSNKTNLIQVTVYLSDISNKAKMDAVWRKWIGGEENWPQRACVGVQLSPGYLIEVVAIAALE